MLAKAARAELGRREADGVIILTRPSRMVNVKGWRRSNLKDSVALFDPSRLMSADKEALLAEDKKVRRLARAMDLASILLWQSNLSLEEAQDVIDHARRVAMELFPGKEETFDLIYGSRFRRILAEKYLLQ